jgi:hypothetical protein
MAEEPRQMAGLLSMLFLYRGTERLLTSTRSIK